MKEQIRFGYAEFAGSNDNLIITTPHSRGKIIDVTKRLARELDAVGIYPTQGITSVVKSEISRNIPYRKRLDALFAGLEISEGEKGQQDMLAIELNPIEDSPADLTVGCSFTNDEDIWKIAEAEAEKSGYLLDHFWCPNNACNPTVTAHQESSKQKGVISNYLTLYLPKEMVDSEDEDYLKELKDFIDGVHNKWKKTDVPKEGDICQIKFSRIKASETVSKGSAQRSKVMSPHGKVIDIGVPFKSYGGEKETNFVGNKNDATEVKRTFYPNNGWCFVSIPRVAPNTIREPVGSLDIDKAETICGDEPKKLQGGMAISDKPFDELSLASYLEKIKKKL